MSITKQTLLDSCALRFEWVEIDGVGRVGIRSVPEVQLSRRRYMCLEEPHRSLADVYMLVDQLMTDEQTPMFEEADADALGQLDGDRLDPYKQAVYAFNAPDQKKVKGESNGT